jgi:RNA-directed DNA polymerase
MDRSLYRALADSTSARRGRAVGSAGVASPLLANLFLHYALDRWLAAHYPQVPFERYADDVIAHCRTEKEAQEMRKAIAARLQSCGLELHPEKTKIVYCKDDSRKKTYPNEKFDFLGYTFRPRRSTNRKGKVFINFSPAVSDRAAKAIRDQFRSWKLPQRSDKAIDDLSRMFNPIIRGWLQYSGDIIARRFTRPCANWTEIWSFGPSRNTRSCVAIFVERHTGSRASRVVLRSCSPTGRWGRGMAP